MNRRNFVTTFGAAAVAAGLAGKQAAMAQSYASATRGLPPLKITNVKVILTSETRFRKAGEKAEQEQEHTVPHQPALGNHP